MTSTQIPLTQTLPGRLPLLDELLQVGPDRPLGSIAIGKLHDARIDPSDVLAVLSGRPGVRTKVFSQEECSFVGGAIFAWHEAALDALIRGHLPLLIETGWPTMHPAQFVGAVAAVHTGEPETLPADRPDARRRHRREPRGPRRRCSPAAAN